MKRVDLGVLELRKFTPSQVEFFFCLPFKGKETNLKTERLQYNVPLN